MLHIKYNAMSNDSDEERLNNAREQAMSNAIKQAVSSGAAGNLLDALLEGSGLPRRKKINATAKDGQGQGHRQGQPVDVHPRRRSRLGVREAGIGAPTDCPSSIRTLVAD